MALIRYSIIQILVLIIRASSNLLPPEYSVKSQNTEKIILSLGEPDENNFDLELIKDEPDFPELDYKLNDFHNFVKISKSTQKPFERIFLYKVNFLPDVEISYPDSMVRIARSSEELSKLERRSREYRKPKLVKPMETPTTDKLGIRKRQSYTTTNLNGDNYLDNNYNELVVRSVKENKAFNYSDSGKPEESFKDVVKKIMDIKTPANCTNVKGIGIQAMECLVKNALNKNIPKKEIIKEGSPILLIWFCVYLGIAIPLWCTRGWCFCCCRCKFCFPRKRVEEIQKYITDNPPGIFKNEMGEEEQYEPKPREIELYENMRKSILDF